MCPSRPRSIHTRTERSNDTGRPGRRRTKRTTGPGERLGGGSETLPAQPGGRRHSALFSHVPNQSIHPFHRLLKPVAISGWIGPDVSPARAWQDLETAMALPGRARPYLAARGSTIALMALGPTSLSPGATQPRVTERPRPLMLLGATHTVCPASPAPSRVGRLCCRHRATLPRRAHRPVTGLPVRSPTVPHPPFLDQHERLAALPLPDSRTPWSFGFPNN
jgi:hypothetical protein